MSELYKIMDNTIGYVYKKEKKINNVAGLSLYFSRKTVDSNLPIEISFVNYNGKINAVSRQLQAGRLDIVTMNGSEKFIYKNDIIFDVKEVSKAIDSIDNVVEKANTVSIISDLFGIDLSEVSDINGFKFDKMIYIDRMNTERDGNYLDGYMLIFSDIATSTMKMGVYCGELTSFTYKDYMNKINSYGKNRILSEIVVENLKNTTIVKNTSEFRVELVLSKYTYDIKRAVYEDKNFTKKNVDSFNVTLEPGEEYSFVHQKSQRSKKYTLLDNPIDAPAGPIYANDNNQYIKAIEYINEEPFHLELNHIFSAVGISEPNKYIAFGSFHHLFLDRGIFEKAIVNKNDDLLGLKVSSENGKISVSNDAKFKDFISSGSAGVFADRIKFIMKAKLKKIYSYLGEDEYNIRVDYSEKSTKYRILSMQNRIVYNDTISTPQQAFVVTVGLVGNINDILQKSSHLEYDDLVAANSMPCKDVRKSTISKIIGSELFKSSYLKFNANDIINNPTKRLYQGPLYKTYNGEIDDAYAMYEQSIVSEISGFNLVDFSSTLTSKEFAAVMPSLNMQEENSNSCREDFVFSVQESIDELGLEISLNSMLEKMKRIAYVYRQEDEIIATMTLGHTLDGQWYFCGEDFFPAESIENAEYTTYMNNEIVDLQRDKIDGLRAIYDKKLFLDSNDWSADYKQYMHDAYLAIVTGSIKTSTINDNPGMRYIVEHVLDSERKLSVSYDELFMQSRELIYSKNVERIQNTMLMPNIFKQLMSDKKIGYVGDSNVHFFGKLRRKYLINYSDLHTKDAYDSAYEIGHTVDAMMNIDNMKKGSKLFDSYGKILFGVNTGMFAVVDSLSIVKKANITLDGDVFSFSVTIVKNNVDGFTIGYDYKTKRLIIVNHLGFDIVSYPLLLASFDILLHDYYHSLEGYSRVALGVYDFYNTKEDDSSLSKQYLLLNNTLKDEREHKLISVVVGVFDEQLEISSSDSKIDKLILGYLDDNTTFKVDVSLDNNNLSITKEGSSPILYNMGMLENYPSSKIIADGSYIQMYRIKRFLPKKYYDKSLTRVTIGISSAEKDIKSLKNMVGDLKVIDFSSYKEFISNNGTSYVYALGGEGLIFWKKYDRYITPPKLVYDIDFVMENLGLEQDITIDDLTFKITFE